MRIRGVTLLALVGALGAADASFAQERLSLAQAVAQALAQNPDVRASRAAEQEAAARVTQARAGYLPRVDWVESWQRGNQPVFVFSSLLSERRFTEANFAIDALNHPDPVSNYRSGVSVEQIVFDGGRVRAGMRAAELGRQIAESGGAQTANDLTLATTQAYGRLLLAAANRRAAEAAIAAAEEDARTAEHRRDAGLGTEADLLSLQVHLAQMRERQIRAGSDEKVARAELNRLMSAPLDREYVLDEPAAIDAVPSAIAPLETDALRARPEVARAAIQEQLARTSLGGARSAFLPQIAFQGIYELNGASFGDRVSAWTVGAQARWNLFAGTADLARLREAGYAAQRAHVERERLEGAIRVEVRSAAEQLAAARARDVVGRAAVAQARESQRMIRDRYEAGLAGVTDVLRVANALLEAEAQRTAALVDVMVSRAALDRAVGRR